MPKEKDSKCNHPSRRWTADLRKSQARNLSQNTPIPINRHTVRIEYITISQQQPAPIILTRHPTTQRNNPSSKPRIKHIVYAISPLQSIVNLRFARNYTFHNGTPGGISAFRLFQHPGCLVGSLTSPDRGFFLGHGSWYR